jgi:hypothetical protein
MEKCRKRILVCPAEAGLVFDGVILGGTTTNVATVLGIAGVGLVVTLKRTMNDGGE